MLNNQDIPFECLKAFNGDKMAASVWMNKYALKDSQGILYENTPDEMHNRIAKNLAKVESKFPNPLTFDKLKSLMQNFKYIIPQGGPMAGIGNTYQVTSLSNCFVIANETPCDSYAGILRVDEMIAQLQKRRGGVGTDVSFIRPKMSMVKNSAGTSTGVVPFMERYSNTTNEVAQDGRRGALMLSIDVRHPDVLNFINAKKDLSKITGANISVKLRDDFMESVRDKKLFTLQFPVDAQAPMVEVEVDSSTIWDSFINNTWATGEPGALFWDTILKESISDCYGIKSVTTNPCGEIVLQSGGSCILLSMNLSSYVKNPFHPEATFDFALFQEHVYYAVKMLDDIVELELEKIEGIISKVLSDPEPEYVKDTELRLWQTIKSQLVQTRRIGLGVTAAGDTLAFLNLKYGSYEGNKKLIQIHQFMKLAAYRASVKLAKDRGAFPLYDSEIEKDNPFIKRIKEEDGALYSDMIKYGRRNITLLTIPPTGTTSIMTQTSSGIEPVFKVIYTRRRKLSQNENYKPDFIDDNGQKWKEYKVFHHGFKKWLQYKGYSLEQVSSMSDQEIEKLVKESPYYKAEANDIDWLSKVTMQGGIQKHVDQSISVTINLPTEVKPETIEKLFLKAWEVGCKGLTIYRDGCRSGILISNKKTEKINQPIFTKRPTVLDADVMRFQNNYEKWIAFLGVTNENGKVLPYEMFTGKLDAFPIPKYVESGKIIKRRIKGQPSIYDFMYVDKNGDEVVMEGLSQSFNKEFWNYAKLISGLLRHRMPLVYIMDIVKNLDLENNSLNSWKMGVYRLFKKYIENGTISKTICPKCGANLIYTEGCLKCESCGLFSACG